MKKAEEKTVLVFVDEIAKILLCDLECQIDSIGKADMPIVHVLDSEKSYYGDLTENEVAFFKEEKPESLSIWLERSGEEVFDCVSRPSESGLLENLFQSELLKRFKAYAAALQELGVKELELCADETSIENYDADEDSDYGASLDVPVASAKGEYHDEGGDTSAFRQEVQKAFKVKFDCAVIVDVDSLKPQLEKDGFWTDDVVQAIVRARKQGRELEHVEMKISANVSREVSTKFKRAAKLEAEAKTWQVSGSANASQSGNVKALSSLAQSLSVIVSTGFSSADGKAKRKGKAIADDIEETEDVEVADPEVKQIASLSETPAKKLANVPTCPACGASVSAKAKFCSECGSPLARKCATCGTELNPGMKFCPECGAKI
jgi:hypothetical protein